MGCGDTSSYSQIGPYTWRAGGQEGHEDDSTSGLSVDWLQTSLGLTAGLNPRGPVAEHQKRGLVLSGVLQCSRLGVAGMGRMFTAQPVFHFHSDTAKASPRSQRRPAELQCQQLLWDGAESLGSALGQTLRKDDKSRQIWAWPKILGGLVLCTLLARDGTLLKLSRVR